MTYAAPIPLELLGVSAEDVQVDIWSSGPKSRQFAKDMPIGEARLIGPPGRYEIRVKDRSFIDSRVLVRAAIALEAGPVIVDAPSQAGKDAEITVKLGFAMTPRDELKIVKRGEDSTGAAFEEETAKQSDGAVARLHAPHWSGDYDLIYTAPNLDGFGSTVLDRRPITVK